MPRREIVPRICSSDKSVTAETPVANVGRTSVAYGGGPSGSSRLLPVARGKGRVERHAQLLVAVRERLLERPLALGARGLERGLELAELGLVLGPQPLELGGVGLVARGERRGAGCLL